MIDPGPQKGPASSARINAQTKCVMKELKEAGVTKVHSQLTYACVVCDKVMEPAIPAEHIKDGVIQPYGGGEMILEFTYGSREFDDCSGATRFNGAICDQCAREYVAKMLCRMKALNGESVEFPVGVERRREGEWEVPVVEHTWTLEAMRIRELVREHNENTTRDSSK